MNDTTAEQPGTVALEPPSTVLNPETVKTASGGGQAPLSNDDANQSIENVLDAELTRLKDEDKKAESEGKDKGEKPDQEAKAKDEAAKKSEKDERAAKPDAKAAKEPPAEVKDKDTAEADAKAAKGEAEKPATGQDGANVRQSEGRQHSEPPARFLPEARENWRHVPREVKAEIHRVSDEYERELGEHKAFREELRDYENLAKQHNVTIKGTLDRYVAADRMLNEDFGKGVAGLIKSYGHNPVQAIAMVLRAHGVTPEQYAQQVLKNPQAHQAPAPRAAAPAAQQPSPQIAALEQKISALEGRLASSSVQPIIEQFKAERPDYEQLEPHIAEILKSGVIDKRYGTGLSPQQKLAEAYRMAGGRHTPSPIPDPSATAQDTSQPKTAPDAASGTKSIRGAPDNGADVPVEEDNSDLREMLRKDLRKISA